MMREDQVRVTFSPERLRLARQRRGFLVQEVAALVGVSGKSVSSWEHSKKSPTAENIDALAKSLDFPKDFFFLSAPPELSAQTFRSLARMTARQSARATTAGVLAVELDRWIGQHYNRPAPNLPDLRDVESETAAEMVRADWGIGFRPLPNLVHLMEKNGVRVYSLVHDHVEVDAFSAWSENTPFVFLNTTKTAERGRMDASHELGHLVLHYHVGGSTPKHEDEAQSFAAAFLMPKNAFLSSVPQRATLAAVLEAKQEWGVSAAAYAFRLHALGVIPYWHYRDLCIKLRTIYGNVEPGPSIRRETSQILAKVFGQKADGGFTRQEIARQLSHRLKDLDEMTFGLALTAVPGDSLTHAPSSGSMKLVK